MTDYHTGQSLADISRKIELLDNSNFKLVRIAVKNRVPHGAQTNNTCCATATETAQGQIKNDN